MQRDKMLGELCRLVLNLKGFLENTTERKKKKKVRGDKVKRGCFWETRPVQVHVVSQQRFLSVSDAANSARVNVRLMKYHPVSPEQCFLQHRCKIAESTLLIRGFGSQLLFEIKHVELTAFLKSSVSEICAQRLWGYEVRNLSLFESIRCCWTASHYLHPLWPSPSSLFFFHPLGPLAPNHSG